MRDRFRDSTITVAIAAAAAMATVIIEPEKRSRMLVPLWFPVVIATDHSQRPK